MSIFLYTIFSNSYLLVFYSEQRNIIQNGYIANWNSSGYFELYHPACKYGVKCLTKLSCFHLAKVTFKDDKSFYINITFCGDNYTY